MTTSAFNFYSDPGLAVLLDSKRFAQATDASTGPQDAVVFFGSPDPTLMAQNGASPGMAQIRVALQTDDSSPLPASISLSDTLAGLDAGLQYADLGTSIVGGSGNGVPLYIRCDISKSSSKPAGSYPAAGKYARLGFPDGIYEDLAV